MFFYTGQQNKLRKDETSNKKKLNEKYNLKVKKKKIKSNLKIDFRTYRNKYGCNCSKEAATCINRLQSQNM